MALPAGAAEPARAKLDAALAAMADDPSASAAAKRVPKRYEPGRPEPLIQTILRFDGSLDAVKAQGAVVRSVIGDIATVDIPADRIAAVAALPSVVFIEAARTQPTRLDVSVPATRADALRTGTAPNWTGGTGQRVILVAAAGKQGTFPSVCGNVRVVSGLPNPNNDDRQLYVTLEPGSAGKLTPGTWTITLLGDVVDGGSSPFSIICAENAGDLTFTSHLARCCARVRML